MRRRRKSEDSSSTELNMTPLIDMIFILLIFFMVTSSFVREAGVDVERPEAKTATSRKPAMILAIDAQNRIWFEGKTVDVRSVRTLAERLHAENPDANVVVAGDAMSRSGLLIEVLDACKSAGIRDVSVGTKNGE